MDFNDLMTALSVHWQRDDLQRDAGGACALQLDHITMSFYPDTDGAGFTARAPIGHAAINDATLHEKLLTASLYGDGTGTTAFGMDNEGRVWLVRRFHCVDLTFESFVADLERFVEHAEYWQTRLGAIDDRHTCAPTAAAKPDNLLRA